MIISTDLSGRPDRVRCFLIHDDISSILISLVMDIGLLGWAAVEAVKNDRCEEAHQGEVVPRDTMPELASLGSPEFLLLSPVVSSKVLVICKYIYNL